MKRAEKKKRLREKRRRQEASRRANKEKARLDADGAPAIAGDASVAPTEQAGAAPDAPPTEDELKDAARDSQAVLDAARHQQSEARERLKEQGHVPGRKITDERALRMLEKAAEYAEYVFDLTREILEDVPHERKLEAVQIIRESDFAKAAPDKGHNGTPQKRPRRGHDPVVTLMKLGMQASNLLNRILAKTNPGVAKLRRAA